MRQLLFSLLAACAAQFTSAAVAQQNAASGFLKEGTCLPAKEMNQRIADGKFVPVVVSNFASQWLASKHDVGGEHLKGSQILANLHNVRQPKFREQLIESFYRRDNPDGRGNVTRDDARLRADVLDAALDSAAADQNGPESAKQSTVFIANAEGDGYLMTGDKPFGQRSEKVCVVTALMEVRTRDPKGSSSPPNWFGEVTGGFYPSTPFIYEQSWRVMLHALTFSTAVDGSRTKGKWLVLLKRPNGAGHLVAQDYKGQVEHRQFLREVNFTQYAERYLQ